MNTSVPSASRTICPCGRTKIPGPGMAISRGSDQVAPPSVERTTSRCSSRRARGSRSSSREASTSPNRIPYTTTSVPPAACPRE